jgi:hypothetical protein
VYFSAKRNRGSAFLPSVCHKTLMSCALECALLIINDESRRPQQGHPPWHT